MLGDYSWELFIFASKYDMVSERLFLACSLLFLCMCAKGQRQILLLDGETHTPIKEVSVKTGKDTVYVSNEKGLVTLSLPFDTIRFSHVMYLSEMLYRQELRDTMYLFPKKHMLPEVVVSELPPEVKSMISGWVAQAAQEGAMNAPQGIASFDFASMLDRRKRRDKKHLKKAKEILEQWDKKKTEENTSSP